MRIEDRVAELERRVAALEGERQRTQPPPPPKPALTFEGFTPNEVVVLGSLLTAAGAIALSVALGVLRPGPPGAGRHPSAGESYIAERLADGTVRLRRA